MDADSKERVEECFVYAYVRAKVSGLLLEQGLVECGKDEGR